MRILSAQHIGVAAVLVVAVAGCDRERPVVPVEQPPFELVAGNRLRVREDLAALLKFANVGETDVASEVTGLGQVQFAPGAAYALRVPFDGYVETVLVEVGEQVTDNQVLATIRSSELAKMRGEINRLTAELDAEYDALKRTDTLVSKGATSERKMVEIRSRIGSLEAQRDGIRFALSAARTGTSGDDLFQLRAPRSGHVILRRLDPGEQVEDPENVPAFVIADPRRLVLKANFPERDAPLLQDGFPCRITVPSLGEMTFSGKVHSVVRAIDPRSRTVQALCTFDVHDEKLRSEMLARVTVSVLGARRLVVPRSAVLLRRDLRVVLVRVGERELERRVVVTGANVNSQLEVLSGLTGNEEVVVEGAVLLDGELDRLL